MMWKLLVVDDDEALRVFLRKVLERAGHTVLVAGNGREALRLLEREPVDGMISDMIMPECEGVETLLAVRKRFPALRVVAISGGGRLTPSDLLTLAQAAGARKTLAKPFTAEELLAVVNEVMAA